VVGAIDSETLAWLKAQRAIEPRTAEISVREGLIGGTQQARHLKAGDGLTPEEWRRLPEILDQPSQVLFDTRTGKLVYVAATDQAGIKLVVAFDYRVGKTGRTNQVVSGFRQSADTLAEMIRGGLYKVVR
jgi:hypothetical protein